MLDGSIVEKFENMEDMDEDCEEPGRKSGQKSGLNDGGWNGGNDTMFGKRQQVYLRLGVTFSMSHVFLVTRLEMTN